MSTDNKPAAPDSGGLSQYFRTPKDGKTSADRAWWYACPNGQLDVYVQCDGKTSTVSLTARQIKTLITQLKGRP